MTIIKNEYIKNWTAVLGHRPKRFGIEVAYFESRRFSSPKLYIIALMLFLISSNLHAQKNDYMWPMGSYGFSTIDRIKADSIEKTFWPFSLNFNNEPMSIDYFPFRRFIFDATNSTYGNNEGALYCYSNGMEVFGPDDRPIVGGDTIMYGEYWRNSVYWRTGDRYGFAIPQGSIMLPIPTDGGITLYVFTTFFDTDISRSTSIWYATIDMACDDGRGCVTTKDNVLLDARVKDGILQACRHANGRDWWLYAVNADGTTYYTFLLDPSGVRLVHTQQIGRVTADVSAGNAVFSQQGDKYAVVDGGYWDSMGVVSIYDFDRCTGLLRNPFFDTLVIPRFSLGQGASFSPDGRYFYANNMNDLYQYDMADLSQPRVHLATYDGFYFGTTPGFRTTQFGFWATGPDGRLYNVSGAASAKHMHVMDYPNEAGDACSFRQHAIKIPNNPFSIPNFPHYRLGPLDGSPCDTLGLDNHPIAKYRYEADSIDYLRLRFTDLSYFRPETWSWDFGDGSPRVSTQSPYHTFVQKWYLPCMSHRQQ